MNDKLALSDFGLWILAERNNATVKFPSFLKLAVPDEE